MVSWRSRRASPLRQLSLVCFGLCFSIPGMRETPNSIKIPQRVLLGPGPSDVPARVLSALGRPTIGHLDPVFLGLMDDIRSKLREVFRTKNEMTLAVSGTGSAGMETVFVNLVEPGDVVLVCVNGVVRTRKVDLAPPRRAPGGIIEGARGRGVEQEQGIDGLRRPPPQG